MLRAPSHLAICLLVVLVIFLTRTDIRLLSDRDGLQREARRRQDSIDNSTSRLMKQNYDLRFALQREKDNAAAAVAAATEAADAMSADADANSRPSGDAERRGFAYLFYATSNSYACSALVNVHRLQHVLNATIPIHVLLSPNVDQRYADAMSAAGATVHVEVPPPHPSGAGYYQDCLLKLVAFNMHNLSPGLTRVLVMDSDQLVVRNLDDLFDGLPEIDLAAPRAYWLAKDFLASTFMMIGLSDRLWKSVELSMSKMAADQFDMDLVNTLLGETALTLSGEFVTLNSHWEDWKLPTWYHPLREINMTTVDLINSLHRIDVAEGEASRAEDRQRGGSIEAFDGHSDPDEPRLDTPSLAARPAVVDAGRAISASPRFPLTHPLSTELFRLRDAAAVIHFTAVGKPWSISGEMAMRARPDAHPALGDIFDVWRKAADSLCPAGAGRGF